MGVKLIPQAIKVKTISYTITLPPQLVERLAKPVTGVGGWQSLLTTIKAHVEGDQLELPQAILEKAIPMATQYGSGGYQGVIRWILCLLLAQHTDALLGKPETLKGILKAGAA